MSRKDKKSNNGEIQFITTKMKKQTYKNEDVKLFTSAIVILVVMALCLGGLFYFNGKFVTKDEFQDQTTTTTTEPSYDKTVILINKIFDMKDKNYYVMLYDSGDEKLGGLYSGLVYNYQGELALYSVDLSNKMNKDYYDPKGKENTKPTQLSEVMITQPTLIKFEKNKVSSYVTDKEEIIKLLNEKKTTE